jgi:hypothetical protein
MNNKSSMLFYKDAKLFPQDGGKTALFPDSNRSWFKIPSSLANISHAHWVVLSA